ncbi:DUF202 domain-containing protein [Corynebacterium guangdongense]|uniref:Uncharacterized membrane protein YidH (DUF202 family) n=1 Tax=Corynebacterium guangdongense TaxID=1783348 RepID=A0ABU2A030_9CORY|nr:DUF202 domain-containing protein [Corynebacterium guangdongense]MDR7330548.1 uncharacterized membrane protein YidH (DUF202 family) [Corynebacterium guangdongense]WJZ19102.1 hypothetical protein CGUA_12875 [Corynebacterium guangdongense]
MRPRLHEDPGLQPERTSLAWSRTVLALMVGAATMLRWAHLFPGVIIVLSVILLGLAVVLMATSDRRYRRHASTFGQERAEPKTASVLMLSVCLVVFGASELVMMLITVG